MSDEDLEVDVEVEVEAEAVEMINLTKLKMLRKNVLIV
jgi:hypothetical protein